ncbi:Peptidase M16 inactive domain protein [compost metagenome]
MASPSSHVSLTSLVSQAHKPIQAFTLANGLTIHLQEDHSSPLACAQLWYRIGASHDLAGSTNLAHVLEHMLFEGSGKLAPGQYSRIISRLGGTSNASTLEDGTMYEVTLPSARLEVALEMMADTMANATLDSTAFAKAAKAVKDERRLKIDNAPLLQAFERHKRLAHGSNAYATPSFGDPRDLEDLQVAAARTWYRTWYHPNNATLVVVGDVDLPRLTAWAERYFAPIAAAPLQPPAPPRQRVPLQGRQQDVTLEGLADGLMMSFNVPSRATATSGKTAPALALALEMLAKGPSASLYGDLVRDRQILTGIGSAYESLLQGDTLLSLYAYSNIDKASPRQAAEHTWSAIEAFKQAPVNAELLERLKFRLLTRQITAGSALAQRARAIGRRAIIGLDPSLMDEELQVLAALTPQDVQQAAVEFLSHERRAITHLLAPPSLPAQPQAPLTCADLAASAAPADLSKLDAIGRIDTDRFVNATPQVQSWRCPQGTRVAFIASRGTPSFELQLHFKAGASQDGNTPGIAALTLYMLDQAVSGLDAQQFAEQLDALAASKTLEITHDHVVVTLSGHASQALRDGAVALITAMVTRPLFETEALDGIKARLIRYLKPREEQPANRIDVEIQSRLFGDHLYGRDKAGTRESIAKADVEMLQAFHRQAYTAESLDITLVGDLDRDEAEELVDSITRALPRQTTPSLPVPPVPPMDKSINWHIEKPGTNIKATLAWPLHTTPDSADYPALQVASTIIGTGFESKLIAELRDRRSLTYSIQAHLTQHQTGGFLLINWDIEPAYLDASLELVRLVIDCFSAQGPSQAELELAVNQQGGELLRTFADNHDMADQLVEINTHDLPADYYDRYLEKLSQLTVADVQAVAQRVFDLKHTVFLSVGPRTAQKALPPLPASDQ